MTRDITVFPPSSRRFVHRSRLISQIDKPDLAPLTLIVAPAGFGKTTLAAQWAEQAIRPVAWITLDAECNSYTLFLTMLRFALESEIGVSGGSGDSITAESLAMSLSQLDQPMTIIFDDYHFIESDDVHRFMDRLIEAVPATISLIVASRTTPPLRIARMRADGLVRQITADDLLFSRDETVEVARTTRTISSRHVSKLSTRTEGWIAGIQLALLALDGVEPGRYDEVIAHFPRHSWLSDYLIEEVVSRLPGALRQFVLQTAMLPWIEEDLGNAVLGTELSAIYIEELERRWVFLRPVSGFTGRYRYHALFAECIARIDARERSEAERAAAHTRAAHWLYANGHLESAIDHYLKGKEIGAATELTVELCQQLIARGLGASAKFWIERLPQENVVANDVLAQSHLLSLTMSHQLYVIETIASSVTPRWSASDDPFLRATAANTLSMVACLRADYDEALRKRLEALRYFSLDQVVNRLFAWVDVAVMEFARGNDELAQQAFRIADACISALPDGATFWQEWLSVERADGWALRGDIVGADRVLKQIIDSGRHAFESRRPKLSARRALLLLELGETECAVRQLETHFSDVELYTHFYSYGEFLLATAKVHSAAGRLNDAIETTNLLKRYCYERGTRVYLDGAIALQVSIWLEHGEIDLARFAMNSAQKTTDSWPLVFGFPDLDVAQIQVSLALGEFEQAHLLATSRIDEGVARKRWSDVLPLYLYDAIAQQALGCDAAAVQALTSALNIAVPGKFIRTLLPGAVDPRPLYRQALPALRDEHAAYLQSLFPRFGESIVVQDKSLHATTSSVGLRLSAREQEVLQLIAEGLTNAEIGARLFISELTVKRHVGNLLAKFHVANRKEAVRKGEELGLLSTTAR